MQPTVLVFDNVLFFSYLHQSLQQSFFLITNDHYFDAIEETGFKNLPNDLIETCYPQTSVPTPCMMFPQKFWSI